MHVLDVLCAWTPAYSAHFLSRAVARRGTKPGSSKAALELLGALERHAANKL